METQFNYDYLHWDANKEVMENIKKREKSPETLQLIGKRKEIFKPGNIGFKVDSRLNRKIWVPRWPEKWGRDEVAAIDLELHFRNEEKNRWVGGYFEFNEAKPNSSKEKSSTLEQNTIEPEAVSSTDEGEVGKSASNFPIVDLKDHDIAKKRIFYIQINDVIDKSKTKNAEAGEKLSVTKFNFMIVWKALIHKTSRDPKLLQLKICVPKNQNDRAPEEVFPFLSEITERFGSLLAGTGLWFLTNWKNRLWMHYNSDCRVPQRYLRKAICSGGPGWSKTLKTNAADAPHAWVSVRIWSTKYHVWKKSDYRHRPYPDKRYNLIFPAIYITNM